MVLINCLLEGFFMLKIDGPTTIKKGFNVYIIYVKLGHVYFPRLDSMFQSR